MKAANKVTGKKNSDYTIESLVKALSVLNVVAESERGVSLVEVAETAKISTSTTFRLLWNLEKAGYATRHEDGYFLGPAILPLLTYYQKQNAVMLSSHHAEHLRDQTGETVSLLVRNQNERVCLYVAESRQPVRRVVRTGVLGPIWRGSAGRVLLAFAAQRDREGIIKDLENQEALRKELEVVRTQGFCLSMYDTSADVWSVAAPIRSASGHVVAAISCSGPVQRADSRHMELCKNLTVAAAIRWSEDLGGAS